jgi:hypothetical protein
MNQKQRRGRGLGRCGAEAPDESPLARLSPCCQKMTGVGAMEMMDRQARVAPPDIVQGDA